MIGLLDTHAFIWWDSDPSKLSPRALAFLQNPSNTVLLSVASVWEMQVKHQLGKLTLRLPLPTIIAQQQAQGIQILPVNLDHVLAIDHLPPVHKDPFDRILAAQSRVENAELVSNDAVFAHYPVNVLW